MVKQTDTKKSGLDSRMEDFLFEITTPDGKKTEVSNDKNKPMKDEKN